MIAAESLEKLRSGYTDFPVWNKRCADGLCVSTTRMDTLDHPERREVLFLYGGTKQRFEIPTEEMLNRAAAWSNWQSGEGLRFRGKKILNR